MCGIAGLACCITSQAASCLCAACPSCRNSTSSKIMYSVFLLLGSITSMIMCTNDVQSALRKVPFLCKGSKSDDTGLDCDRLVGFEAVYRVCFGMTCFYWLFMLLMIGVRSSRDPRGGIQNGFWGLKFLILIAFVVAAFFIPSDPFVEVWYVFGLIGGFAFILVQLILYIDFTFNWNESWVGKMEEATDENDRKCWFATLLITTVLIYAMSAVGIGFMFHYYTGFHNNAADPCHLHKFFISFNMILCMVLTVVSILPKVQDTNPSAGLLQSSVISAYVMYLTWSAMASNPSSDCNPSLTKILNATADSTPEDTTPKIITGYDSQSILGLVIFFIAVLYSSIRNSSQADRMGLNHDSVAVTEPSEPIHDNEMGGQKVWDDEEEQVTYNHSYFHFMFSIATMYVMMTLTYWFDIGSINSDKGIAGYAPVWVKIVSSWLCVALYIWVLIAPAILSDREFNF